MVVSDDIGYVQQDREEMEVLFTFLAERYERRSVMISSNLVFSKWDQIFKDRMTTMAAIDRLVHHALILEFDGRGVSGPKSPGARAEMIAPFAPAGSTPSLAPARQRRCLHPQGQIIPRKAQLDETLIYPEPLANQIVVTGKE